MEQKSIDNIVMALLGIVIFIFIMLVLYVLILVVNTTLQSQLIDLQPLFPLVIFGGFFLFIIAAVILGLLFFKMFGGFHEEERY